MLAFQKAPGTGGPDVPRSLPRRPDRRSLARLFVGLACFVAAAGEAQAQQTLDRVLDLEIQAHDRPIEGHGPAALAQYDVDFNGTLHIWTRSDLDLFLRAEDLATGQRLAEDEDSGGGTTPYLRLAVQPGTTLRFSVAGRTNASIGPVGLCFAAAPVSDLTIRAVTLGRQALAAATDLAATGLVGGVGGLGLQPAGLGLATSIEQVMVTAGGGLDEELAGVLGLLAGQAEVLQINGPACAARRAIYQYQNRTRPWGHPDLLGSSLNLATDLFAIRDRAGASALLEPIVNAYDDSRLNDDSVVVQALSQLALVRRDYGDLNGALALNQRVLNIRQGQLGRDDPAVLIIRQRRASLLGQLGDTALAIRLQGELLDDCRRVLPPLHPTLIQAQRQQALWLHSNGDVRGARVLQEGVLGLLGNAGFTNNPQLLSTRLDLATSMRNLGEYGSARDLEQGVLAAYQTFGAFDRTDLLRARGNLAITLAEAGDITGSRQQADALAIAMQQYALDALALSPDDARNALALQRARLGQLLYFATGAGVSNALRFRAFELAETMRWVGTAAGRIPAARPFDPEFAALMAARRGLQSSYVKVTGGIVEYARTSNDMLLRVSAERDRVDNELRGRLAGWGLPVVGVGLPALAAALRPDEVAVGYRRVPLWGPDPQRGHLQAGVDHLQASIVRPDGTLVWLNLGPIPDLELMVSAWRASIGQPPGGSGSLVTVGGKGNDPDFATGRLLRQRLIDPIVAAAGPQAKVFFVAPDDLLFLLPLDALPMESGEQVGDHLRIVNQVSFARLLFPYFGPIGLPGLLVLGGADFGAGLGVPGFGVPGSRQFTRLSGSGSEAQSTAALFRRLARIEPVFLTQGQATKTALFAQAPGARYVHIATQGWINSGTQLTSSYGVQTSGAAPILGYGLALAGANRGRNSLGRYDGILTANELCSLNLVACELVVVNTFGAFIGLPIGPAAQAIRTLQTSLWAAGARSSLISLWPVSNDAARKLMDLFYTELWDGELGKADALWQAKAALREEGHPLRDWAGWVLTGDPD